MPTRLLFVGSLGDSDHLRLVDIRQGDVRGPYAALSHMWGGPDKLPPLQTILSTYEKLKSGIPVWTLPKNFADAVFVTRQLGLQYIWIDSLCIIQDSPSDWHKEAATMHQVYRFADVTIVAYVPFLEIPFRLCLSYLQYFGYLCA